MSDVELVALWLGLGAGLISIVLAVVAMVFTFAVDRRSSAINEQMIKSLQKIESTVEGVAGDTADLIKVAWDRMLPGGEGVATDQNGSDEESIRAIAAGVAAELKAELTTGEQEDNETIKRLDAAVRRLEGSMRAQLSSGVSESSSTAQRIDRLHTRLSEVSPAAREIARQIAETGRHLTRDEYGRLREGPLKSAVADLRRGAILVPLKGKDADGEEIPVYFFSPGTWRLVPPVLALLEPTPRRVRDRVRQDLRAAGYPVSGDEVAETPSGA